ncbi:MAG: hypothetical protein ABJA02_08260 [Acidobacteriota bacterium]
MARSTIHISVPDTTRSYVEARVTAAGYGSVSEYFRELIRRDRLLQIRLAASEKDFNSHANGWDTNRPPFRRR